MALLNLFKKKLKGENQYFERRKSDEQETELEQVKTAVNYLVSDRKITKDLLSSCLKTMRSHDVNACVAVLANTIDTVMQQAGIMINKGYIPKKIVSYLQNITIHEIESALKLVKSDSPDDNGFFPIDERTAAQLNLPMGCMLCGIVHHLKKEFGLVLVLKSSLKDKAEFMKKVKDLIK